VGNDVVHPEGKVLECVDVPPGSWRSQAGVMQDGAAEVPTKMEEGDDEGPAAALRGLTVGR